MLNEASSGRGGDAAAWVGGGFSARVMTRYAFVEAISRGAAVRRASSPGVHSLLGNDARFARRRPGSDLPRRWPGLSQP